MDQSEVTIKDVAKRAGVSVSTVSRVLNGLDRVSEQTRKKVQKVIEELNYVPSSMAASMIRKQTNMLAVVVPVIQNPFYPAVIQGTFEVAKREGYHTFVIATNEDKEAEAGYIEGFLNKNVDGMILIGVHKDPEFYRSIRKPVVLVDRYIEHSGLDGVVIDNFRGAYEATIHLLENGHRRIAIIIGPQDFNDGKERYWGYRQALAEYGVKPEPMYHKQGNWFEDNGYRSTMELMQLECPPTAIFAANNLICQGTIKALRDLNITIGEDVSLVGFDENELAEFVRPRVTVVRRPMREMGTQAAELLIQNIKKKHISGPNPKKLTLGVELLKFDSVKNLNR